MASNLPPGVTDGMIPGNSGEDEAWEKFHEQIDDDVLELGLLPETATLLWKQMLAGTQLSNLQRNCLDNPKTGFEPDLIDQLAPAKETCLKVSNAIRAKWGYCVDKNGKPEDDETELAMALEKVAKLLEQYEDAVRPKS